MTRLIVGFDPSKAQAAIAELRDGLGPGIEWRVLNLDQNPHGVQPVRPTADEEQQDESPNLLERLTGWLGGGDEAGAEPPHTLGPLDLNEDELAYLRRAPARAGTVILVTAPDDEDATVRTWSVRHGGFSLSPVPGPDTETEIKES